MMIEEGFRLAQKSYILSSSSSSSSSSRYRSNVSHNRTAIRGIMPAQVARLHHLRILDDILLHIMSSMDNSTRCAACALDEAASYGNTTGDYLIPS